MDWGQILNNTAYWLFSPETIAYALAATGLAVHFGYAGLLNFGMAGFMALGAYGYAISILTFGWPWWVGIIVGCLAAVVFAIILGIPTLRLRADYLAIVTIAAAEIVRLALTTQLFDEWTNSADGLGGYHAGFRAANPSRRARTASAHGRGRRISSGCASSASSCWRSPSTWCGRSCAARGAACSRASARTRTPCARSARTSSPTRCRP
nr:hypothetical protein GCM10025699_02690 [Microbacterium flavescens]